MHFSVTTLKMLQINRYKDNMREKNRQILNHRATVRGRGKDKSVRKE